MKDKELEKLLSPVQFKAAEEEQIKRWQAAVHAESTKFPKMTVRNLWWQWLVAAGVGFACAAIFFHQSPQNLGQVAQENNFEDATYEYVYSK
jgi:hypothetical protein